jgi:hypothetical protein
MILLRPYAAYQLSTRANISSDPMKVQALLQRLIKKKDEHHEAQELLGTENRSPRFIFISPVLPVNNLAHFFCSFFFFLTILTFCRQAVAAFYICPENHRYRLISCFQI